MASLSLSYSGATTWRDCEQRYWYRYEEKLHPKTRGAPLTLGNWLHSYLERYYKAIRYGVAALEAHEFALNGTTAQYQPELEALAGTAEFLNQHELSKELLGLSALGADIAGRYYHARGKTDADRYEILFVELRLNVEADTDVRSPGIIDLVVRDLDRGVLQMWDHKSTGNAPAADTHLLDMQQVLYAAMLEESRDIEVDELVWNYLRTKPPTEPATLKAGGLSKAKNIDTDAATYREAILRGGHDVGDYGEVLSRLAGRELSVFYPRHVTPLRQETEPIILGDFLRTAEDVQRAKSTPGFRPVRNIGYGCNRCDYRALCEAVVTGGDVHDLILRNFD